MTEARRINWTNLQERYAIELHEKGASYDEIGLALNPRRSGPAVKFKIYELRQRGRYQKIKSNYNVCLADEILIAQSESLTAPPYVHRSRTNPSGKLEW